MLSIAIEMANRGSPESLAVYYVHRMERGTVVGIAHGQDVPAGTMPVGSVRFVLDAFHAQGLPEPPVIHYPKPLRSFCFMGRRVARMSLAEARRKALAQPLWCKADGHEKPFPPGTPLDLDPELPDELPVWAAPPVTFLSEWRFYIAQQRILFSERYDPYGVEEAPRPDLEMVTAMLSQPRWALDAPAGYSLDVGVLANGRTVLVEVNDGWALGFYGRMSLEHCRMYRDLLVQRYLELRDAPDTGGGRAGGRP
ncbi:ATP-grasp domain-containing protein [Thiomonas sp.]